MTENEIAALVVDTSFHVHRELGSGLFESVYERILAFELETNGLTIARQVLVPVVWKGYQIEECFRADMIVDGKVILELKSIEKLLPVHRKQLLTYLRITNLRLGLLLNFGSEFLKDGIVRLVNNLPD
jgi:GxxExxY protein